MAPPCERSDDEDGVMGKIWLRNDGGKNKVTRCVNEEVQERIKPHQEQLIEHPNMTGCHCPGLPRSAEAKVLGKVESGDEKGHAFCNEIGKESDQIYTSKEG